MRHDGYDLRSDVGQCIAHRDQSGFYIVAVSRIGGLGGEDGFGNSPDSSLRLGNAILGSTDRGRSSRIAGERPVDVSLSRCSNSYVTHLVT